MAAAAAAVSRAVENNGRSVEVGHQVTPSKVKDGIRRITDERPGIRATQLGGEANYQ